MQFIAGEHCDGGTEVPPYGRFNVCTQIIRCSSINDYAEFKTIDCFIAARAAPVVAKKENIPAIPD